MADTLSQSLLRYTRPVFIWIDGGNIFWLFFDSGGMGLCGHHRGICSYGNSSIATLPFCEAIFSGRILLFEFACGSDFTLSFSLILLTFVL